MLMVILFTHIVIATAGILAALIALIKTSPRAISASYALTAGTIASGTVLVVLGSAHILKTCVTGLVYTAIVLGLTSIAKQRLENTQ